MSRVYATFSGSKYHATTERIVKDAPKFGADEVWVYDDAWLKRCRPAFCERTSWFFQQRNRKEGGPRGVNWFCFKPLTALDAFRRLNTGDVLLYTDADTYPVADLSPLYDRCVSDGGVMLFNARGCLNRQWTKRDIFTVMGCDEPKYHASWQAVARFMLFQKGGAFPAEEFLGQWLGFTCNPFVSTFEPSALGLPDYPGFQENRVEQSVLTNLAVRYGVPLYREACEFGGWQGPALPEDHDGGYPGRQTFSQTGQHTFRPGYAGDESEGSAFRTVND
jgi:hypothetical protein